MNPSQKTGFGIEFCSRYSGELFSVKTSHFHQAADDTIIEDFVQSLKICMDGYLVRTNQKLMLRNLLPFQSGKNKSEKYELQRAPSGHDHTKNFLTSIDIRFYLFNLFRTESCDGHYALFACSSVFLQTPYWSFMAKGVFTRSFYWLSSYFTHSLLQDGYSPAEI